MTPEQQSIHLTGELARLEGEVSRLERELEQERQDRKQADLDTIRALGERNDARKDAASWQILADLTQQRLDKARAEVAEWKRRIIPFLAVHAGNYGREHFGEGCIHYKHYDMLAEAGVRIDDFKRCGDPAEGNEAVNPP